MIAIETMIDTATVFRKEFRELVTNAAGPRGRLGIVIFLAVFGILMPLQTGRDWILTPASLIPWAWLPFLLVSAVIADSVAGERERHTLETLLATRLPDRAILFGKILAAAAYACLQVVIIALAAAAAVNIAYPEGGFVFYSLPMIAGILVYPTLVALLAASIGVLVSIRAETARQAQQVMSAASLAVMLPLLLLNFLPEGMRRAVAEFFMKMDLTAAVTVVTAVLVVLDATLLSLASILFKRRRLLSVGQ
jgi:ABC-2 type transport system permease protein